MRKLCLATSALFLIGFTVISALAQDQARPGSARAGREFVGYNCDACHVVAADQPLRPLVSGYAPSFTEVANRPDMTPTALRDFLSRQHGYSNMPYPDLAPADLANVVAYVMSLRHRHEGHEAR
ncbi:MAG TPA: c-type cytochrome [Stellaceae bacterium]|nr:c-type cytochrome [Stellaceae bacterium]